MKNLLLVVSLVSAGNAFGMQEIGTQAPEASNDNELTALKHGYNLARAEAHEIFVNRISSGLDHVLFSMGKGARDGACLGVFAAIGNVGPCAGAGKLQSAVLGATAGVVAGTLIGTLEAFLIKDESQISRYRYERAISDAKYFKAKIDVLEQSAHN